MKVAWGESVWMDHVHAFMVGKGYLIRRDGSGWRVLRTGGLHVLSHNGKWVRAREARDEERFPDRHAALQALCDVMTEEERKAVFG